MDWFKHCIDNIFEFIVFPFSVYYHTIRYLITRREMEDYEDIGDEVVDPNHQLMPYMNDINDGLALRRAERECDRYFEIRTEGFDYSYDELRSALEAI